MVIMWNLVLHQEREAKNKVKELKKSTELQIQHKNLFGGNKINH